MPRAHVVPDGTKLTALRGEADLTQLELARQAGYGLRTIGKIENGQPTGARTLSAAATVLSRRLGRVITLTDLLKRPNGAISHLGPALDSAGLVQEMIRFLDLSDLTQWQGARPRQQRVLLVDHVRFQRLPGRRTTLCFPYASLGDRAYGECLSHPGQCRWQPTAETPSSNGNPRRGYCLHVDIASLAAGLPSMICNGIEYFGAFAGETGQALEVPIVWPTEGLTVMLVFPQGRPCRSARGRPDGTTAQPVIMPGGKLLHWRINSPPVGTVYRLEWDW